MSNEKNVQPADKKERISVLESIRRRTGLLVGIVGLALLIFILESLLSSGQSIFGGGDASTIGVINGKKIDRNDFLLRVENQLNMIRQQKQTNDIDDATRGQVVDFVWQQMISDMVIKPEYDKVGITVGEDEIYQMVVANPVQSVLQQLSDPKTGQLNPQFARADGSLDIGKWKQVVQSLPPEQEPALRQMEDRARETRYAEKYATLIRKGLYTTSAEAKESYKADNTKLSLTYAIKRFDAVSDSTVKVSEDEIQKYYNDHSYEFKNNETSRKIEYVAFNVSPSQEDLAAIQKDSERAAAEFKGKSLREDSSFIAQESENGNITIQDFTKKSMIVRDSSIFTAPVGTVYGPYNEGAYFKVYKLEAVNSIADSARVRHILVGTIDPQTQQPKKSNEQAKREADSLLTLIKDKKVTFDTLVKTVSDDMGSKTNGGDYGWFDENKGFVQAFKDAGLMGTKGNITVVATQFGYHIIEVLDVSKTRHNSYRVAQIFKLIAPSDETNQKIFATANEFGGKYNNGTAFDKAVKEQKLAPRILPAVKESDRQLPGLDNPKELVKWAYTANKNDVAVFSFNDKHIVAKIAGIQNKGTLPLEEVKDDVIAKARIKKKAEMFIEEFKKAGGKNASEYASKINVDAKNVEQMLANSHNIEGLGHDDILVGTALGVKEGQTSRPTAGDNGVFVITVNKVEASALPADFKMQQKQIEQMVAGRADYEAYNALKDLAEIEDHKSRID